MTKDEVRAEVQQDIDHYRSRIAWYEAQHLFEAASYAKKLADNLELALTLLPRDEDPELP